MEKIVFKIEKKDVKKRLDLFLTEQNSELSRSQIKNLITDGNVLRNGQKQKSGAILKENDIIELTMPNLDSRMARPENLSLEIIYQDEDLAVINKKQGMVVHAGNLNYSGTLVNALLFHFEKLSGINGALRPGIVHRLDKNTSGVMLVAKNDKAHKSLAEQISNRNCVRKYLAILEGNLKENEGIIKTYIGRNPRKRTLMSAFSEGFESEGEKFEDRNKNSAFDENDKFVTEKKIKKRKIAITEYKVLERFRGYCLVEFSLKTGRTHQIRVHCSEVLHHPIVGDLEYGGKRVKNLPKSRPVSLGQYLHAYQIEFWHPSTNKLCVFNAQLPEYFEVLLNFLRDSEKDY